MAKPSNLVVCVLLSVLLAQQRAYGQSYNYWNRVNTCELGQYPACSFDQSSTTNWQWWTTSSGMPTDTTTPQTTTTQAPQVCVSCSAGTSVLGSTSSYNSWYASNFIGCQPCQPGTYANRSGADVCEQCPAGYSCTDPAKDPQPCPLGFYCLPFSTALTTWSHTEMGVPRPCPRGTYANKPGSTECTPCPAGFDCTDPTLPVMCPKGTATEIGNDCIWPPVRCKPCPKGFYAPREGSSTCTRCPEGNICPDATQAIRCPAGTFRNRNPEAIIYPNQLASSVSTSSSSSSDSQDECYRCPTGHFQTAAGQRSCRACPRGFYCPLPHLAPIRCPTGTYSLEGQQSCYPCPDGSYASTTGNWRCTTCPIGYYCNDPNIGPQLCPLGTYSNSTLGQVVCSPCPPNTYAHKIGMSACLECPLGMCCDDPMSSPSACGGATTKTMDWTSSY